MNQHIYELKHLSMTGEKSKKWIGTACNRCRIIIRHTDGADGVMASDSERKVGEPHLLYSYGKGINLSFLPHQLWVK